MRPWPPISRQSARERVISFGLQTLLLLRLAVARNRGGGGGGDVVQRSSDMIWYNIFRPYVRVDGGIDTIMMYLIYKVDGGMVGRWGNDLLDSV